MITETLVQTQIFTGEIETLGERLLHHQCWFFGRDIWHESGNLLIRYGFERIGVPENQSGSNCYCWRDNSETEIKLWGWGVFFGDCTNGILLKRFNFRPRFLAARRLAAPIFQSEQFPPSRFPREDFEIKTARTLTVDFIDWILRYEQWIEKTCGKSWRQTNLREWEKSALPAREIKRNWRELQNKITNL